MKIAGIIVITLLTRAFYDKVIAIPKQVVVHYSPCSPLVYWNVPVLPELCNCCGIPAMNAILKRLTWNTKPVHEID